MQLGMKFMTKTYVRKVKNLVKKILGMNYNLIRSDFDEKNSCKALEDLLEIKPELLNERSMAGNRRDNKEFYPSAKKIADAFDFYRVYFGGSGHDQTVRIMPFCRQRGAL